MALLNFGPLTLTTSSERDNFTALRRRYVELGQKHQRKFYARYTVFKTADDLFEHLAVELNNIFDEIAALVADDLAANRIFDVSEKSIRADLEARAMSSAGRFNRVKDQYLEILRKAEEREVHRQEASDNRGGIVGGGFGVEGAAKGIAVATVANAAIGLVHGLANLTAKAASELGDKDKKRQLLVDPTTKADVGDFLAQVAMQGCELIVASVNRNVDKPHFEPVTDDSREKSAAIVANVAAGRVPDKDVQSVLVQALACDPFNEEGWTEWLDRFGDQDGSLSASADVVGVTVVKDHKAKLFSQRKDALSWNTPEECQVNSVILEQHAEWLGCPFDAERTAIENRAMKLDKKRRTFSGIEYPSLAEATAARQAYEDQLQRTVAGVVYDTYVGADKARASIREQTIAASRSANFGWLILAYRRYRDIAGRSCRKEFFMFALFVITSIIVLAGAGMATLGAIFLLASLIVALPLQIRRFHDQDRSGWFILLNLIPYIGWLIVLVFMLIDGTLGDNKFGPSPKKALKNSQRLSN